MDTPGQAAQLREQLAQLTELLELAPAAIVVRDPATSRIRFWNRGAQDLYGWTASEALGQVTHDLLRTVFPVPKKRSTARSTRRVTGRAT
jgi:PAS domain S-box-containing protein